MTLTIDQAKSLAERLRSGLASRGSAVSHADSLELAATALGYASWAVATAKLQDAPIDGVHFAATIPVLRIFDEAKAREFYCGFLDFEVRFEHRFEPDLPLYMGIARGSFEIHLSEHHGDASPGATVFVPMTGLAALQKELIGKNYGYGRPGIAHADWGDVMEVADPFGNRIRFCQRHT